MFEMVTLGMVPQWLPLPRNRRFRTARRQLEDVVFSLVAEHEKDPHTGDDMISRLLDAYRDEPDAGLRRRRLRDELITILLAGHETTASTLSWTWYLIDRHPEVAERMRIEAAEVLGDSVPGYESLRDLRYTSMVIQEAMRLYPPVWGLPRKAIGEDEIGGVRVPAGADVMISPYTLHRHPDFWPDPERFDPQRFDPASARAGPPLRLHSLRRGPTGLRRQQPRHDGGDSRRGHGREQIPARARPRARSHRRGQSVAARARRPPDDGPASMTAVGTPITLPRTLVPGQPGGAATLSPPHVRGAADAPALSVPSAREHIERWRLIRERATLGDEDATERQHAKGKLTARERLEKLVDKGSFPSLTCSGGGRQQTAAQRASRTPMVSSPGRAPSMAAASSSTRRISASSAARSGRPTPPRSTRSWISRSPRVHH